MFGINFEWCIFQSIYKDEADFVNFHSENVVNKYQVRS